jgi:hypothetical protein
MPYIKEGKRLAMDQVVRAMFDAGVEANGDLNYILYKFAKYHVEPGYVNYKNFLGELNEASEEIRRRLLAPYEDEKITENGDI